MKDRTDYIIAGLRAAGYHKRPGWTWDSPDGYIRIHLRPWIPDGTAILCGMEVQLSQTRLPLALWLYGREILDKKRKPANKQQGRERFEHFLRRADMHDYKSLKWIT